MSDEKRGIFVRQANDTLAEPVSFSTTNGGSISRIPRNNDMGQTPRVQTAPENFSRRPGLELAPMVVTPESSGSETVPEISRSPIMPQASPGSVMGSGQSDMALGVYDAARRAGFSHAGARVLVGEIGRENSLNSNLIFGSHDDPANKARNAGMISWQGSRKDELMKHLAGIPGALDADGKMTKTQANLDGQMSFMRKEMESGKIGRKTNGMAEMLSSEDIDQRAAADAIGRDFIKWRIDDPRYRDKGIANREAFSGKLDKSLAGRGSAGSIEPKAWDPFAPIDPSTMVSGQLFKDTQEAIDNRVGYERGAKNTRAGVIDCSGWVAQINKGLIDDIAKQGEKMTGTKQAEKLFEGGAAEIVGNIAQVTGKVMGNSELTMGNLKEGMIIGENNNTGKGRGDMNIDHVTQVVRDPNTGKLLISQSSSSGSGVNMESAEKYLDRKNAKGTKLFGVDTTAALDKLTAGQYSERASALTTSGQRYADAIGQTTAEADQAQKNSNLPPPIVFNAPEQSSGKDLSGRQSGGGLTAPMTTRNSDSSIRRLTDNFLAGSSALH